MQNNLTTFNTGKVELIAVLLPEGATNPTLNRSNYEPRYWGISYDLPVPDGANYTHGGGFCFFYKDFGGKKKYPENLVLVGSTFDVTEEEARELVEKMPWGENSYKNYKLDPSLVQYVGLSALESWHSLLSHLQIYRENPYKRPNEGEPDEDVFWKKAAQYQRGEARAGNWVFMIKSK